MTLVGWLVNELVGEKGGCTTDKKKQDKYNESKSENKQRDNNSGKPLRPWHGMERRRGRKEGRRVYVYFDRTVQSSFV